MGCDVEALTVAIVAFVSIHAPTWGATQICMCGTWYRSVSIHAPTWGATIGILSMVIAYIVSIHAPTWGATLTYKIAYLIQSGFNPRTHMGCDGRGAKPRQATEVSIHAPTWGATYGVDMILDPLSFNPRTHMGCDPWMLPCLWMVTEFQSTHPHGVRLRAEVNAFIASYVSIHAPTWGATNNDFKGFKVPFCFNPRTHMGCDQSTQ